MGRNRVVASIATSRIHQYRHLAGGNSSRRTRLRTVVGSPPGPDTVHQTESIHLDVRLAANLDVDLLPGSPAGGAETERQPGPARRREEPAERQPEFGLVQGQDEERPVLD